MPDNPPHKLRLGLTVGFVYAALRALPGGDGQPHIRPAIVVNVNPDGSADLLVLHNGMKDGHMHRAAPLNAHNIQFDPKQGDNTWHFLPADTWSPMVGNGCWSATDVVAPAPDLSTAGPDARLRGGDTGNA